MHTQHTHTTLTHNTHIAHTTSTQHTHTHTQMQSIHIKEVFLLKNITPGHWVMKEIYNKLHVS
jgi:hypothetical protein